MGSSVFVVLSLHMTIEGGDPTRIIRQVVTGVGFLGAGVIMHQGTDIQGLTTAAMIWCSTAVGSLAGAGYLLQCVTLTSAIIVVNLVFLKVDEGIRKRGANAKHFCDLK